ncbi:hypothetical protein VTI74DRAFT_11116 [Chaetomium olivicolor]
MPVGWEDDDQGVGEGMVTRGTRRLALVKDLRLFRYQDFGTGLAWEGCSFKSVFSPSDKQLHFSVFFGSYKIRDMRTGCTWLGVFSGFVMSTGTETWLLLPTIQSLVALERVGASFRKKRVIVVARSLAGMIP